jgi:hypothetical protein
MSHDYRVLPGVPWGTLAVLNVVASILAGLGAAYCGMAVAQALAVQ